MALVIRQTFFRLLTTALFTAVCCHNASAQPDDFEPDDRPLIGQGLAFPTGTFLQQHSIHVQGDEDWYVFPDIRPCQEFYDWSISTTTFDGRFQPIVEIYPYEILVDPEVAPTAVYGGCFGVGPPQPSLNFNEKYDGVWRLRNCPDVTVPPETLPYEISAIQTVEVCGPVAAVSGVVRDAQTLAPVTGGVFVTSDQNTFSVANPATGRYSMVVVAAAPMGPPVEVSLAVLSESLESLPLTVSVQFEQTVSDADILVRERSLVFASGFE